MWTRLITTLILGILLCEPCLVRQMTAAADGPQVNQPSAKVTGKVVVMAGGNGEIAATLTFDQAGKLVHVAQTGNLKPSIRPICQATKLLDADPLVRRMAEQDLLILGRTAQEYLAAQRAQASPALQWAIDQLWQRIVEKGR